ncbi:MAG: hypothetical protein MUE49_09815, partial [Rhodospirillales bacterium]|nr:hypothetical protein [Rhodospirillales bacterium]
MARGEARPGVEAGTLFNLEVKPMTILTSPTLPSEPAPRTLGEGRGDSRAPLASTTPTDPSGHAESATSVGAIDTGAVAPLAMPAVDRLDDAPAVFAPASSPDGHGDTLAVAGSAGREPLASASVGGSHEEVTAFRHGAVTETKSPEIVSGNAPSPSGPVEVTSKIVNVGSQAELLAALKSATGGETIVLGDGDYGYLNLRGAQFNAPVTLKAASALSASINRVDLLECGNISFDGINFAHPQKDYIDYIIDVQNSHGIVVKNSVITGS